MEKDWELLILVKPLPSMLEVLGSGPSTKDGKRYAIIIIKCVY